VCMDVLYVTACILGKKKFDILGDVSG